MKQIPRRPFILIGVLLLCGLPVCLLGAVVCAWVQPTRYGATAVLELKHPEEEEWRVMIMLQRRQRELPDAEQLRAGLMPSMKAGRYFVSVTDVTPKWPGELANRWAAEIVEDLNRPWPADVPHARLVKRAESPARRLRPNVGFYVTQVMVPGLVFALVGGLVLTLGLALPRLERREPPPLPGEQSAKADHEDLY